MVYNKKRGEGYYMHNYEELIEPLKYYNNFLRDNFSDATKNLFEKLTKEAGVDIEENERLVRLYNKKESEKKSAKRWSYFYLFIFVADIIISLCFFSCLYNEIEKKVSPVSMIAYAILMTIGILVGIFIIFPLVRKQKKIIKNFTDEMNETKEKCYQTMAILNSLFTSEMTIDLIKETIPFINIDTNFDIRRFEQLVKNYGFLENKDENSSTLSLISGDIIGNPFVFVKNLVHEIVDYEYVGTRVVSYTEHYIDSKGESRSRTVHETLVAKVYKPGPSYSHKTYLVYGSEAAPNLTFNRQPQVDSKANGLGNLFGNFFNSNNKNKLKQIEKEALKKGSNFTPMANEEFEIKFGAFDRDNEQEFRLLFTPLAQKNMLAFLDNKEYGDDLYFYKDKMVNVVYCTHNNNWNIDNNPQCYRDYDYSNCKNNFLALNNKYFADLFFNFIPILSIPLYQQYKSKEYIYGHSFKYNYNQYLTEAVANTMNIDLFKPLESETQIILKTKAIESDDDTDLVAVDAYSYRTEPRYDIVEVMAGNGRFYSVRVDWTLYIPISKQSKIEVSDVKLSEKDYNKFRANQKFGEKLKGFGFKHGLFGALVDNDKLSNHKLKDLFAEGGENAKSIR